jgi:hypothetical protein
VVRPWLTNWGATDEEVQMPLPGDDIAPTATKQNTRAITVNAPAAAIWPWLVQMGQDRGGLYSYEWLENLIGCDMHNADRVHPEWQQIQLGDFVRMYPEGKGPPPFRVAAIMPNEALILGHTVGLVEPEPGVAWDSTWAFILRPLDDQHTRLIIRTRGNDELLFTVIEPGVFIMERGMLRGIKEAVEKANSLTLLEQ